MREEENRKNTRCSLRALLFVQLTLHAHATYSFALSLSLSLTAELEKYWKKRPGRRNELGGEKRLGKKLSLLVLTRPSPASRHLTRPKRSGRQIGTFASWEIRLLPCSHSRSLSRSPGGTWTRINTHLVLWLSRKSGASRNYLYVRQIFLLFFFFLAHALSP